MSFTELAKNFSTLCETKEIIERLKESLNNLEKLADSITEDIITVSDNLDVAFDFTEIDNLNSSIQDCVLATFATLASCEKRLKEEFSKVFTTSCTDFKVAETSPCSICLDTSNKLSALSVCGHVFCTACTEKLQTNREVSYKCPKCRTWSSRAISLYM